jgi:hypothetical protein
MLLDDVVSPVGGYVVDHILSKCVVILRYLLEYGWYLEQYA